MKINSLALTGLLLLAVLCAACWPRQATPTPPASPLATPTMAARVPTMSTPQVRKFAVGEGVTICTLDAWGVQSLGERRSEIAGEWATSGIAFFPLSFGWQATITAVGSDWLEVTGWISTTSGASVQVVVVVEKSKVC